MKRNRARRHYSADVEVEDELMLQTTTFGTPSDSAMLLKSLTSNSRRPNLLLVCSDSAWNAAVRHLSRWCAHPFRCTVFPGPLALPPDRTGTLVLHGVDKMTLAQQIALYDWLTAPGQGPQIVSMTTTPLEPLVMSGHFLEGLLRRLNVVQLDLA